MYGVVTQFILFQEYTTEKRSAVLSTISENSDSDFILIGIDKKIYKQVGKNWYEKKRRLVILKKDFAKRQRELVKVHCL